MSALTKVIGYPVHAVAKFVRWENTYQVTFTAWVARCGAEGNKARHEPFDTAGSARRQELCPKCFPGRDHRAAAEGEPEELAGLDELREEVKP